MSKPRKPIEGQRRTTPLPTSWDRHDRPAILARDGHRCMWATDYIDGIIRPLGMINLPAGHFDPRPHHSYPRRCQRPAEEVDHIGDPNDHTPDNLRALCGPHHRERTGRQAANARWAKAARRQRPPQKHPGLK